MDYGILGKNIRVLRERAGYSIINLAKFMNIEPGDIEKIEEGELTLTTDMLERLAVLFAVTTEKLGSIDCINTDLSVAFRGHGCGLKEMKAIYAVNKIALNSEFMSDLLKKVSE